MHEMSLVKSILEIVRLNIPAGSEHDVKEIRLKIGIAAGVVTDSLEFCFTALKENTDLEQSTLNIEHIPLTLQCNTCNALRTRDEVYFTCPNCGSNNVSILSGTELQVTEIEMNDHNVTAS